MLDTGAMVSGPLHGPSRRHPRVPDVDTWRQVWGPRPVFRPPAGGGGLTRVFSEWESVAAAGWVGLVRAWLGQARLGPL